ncbi:hypothetical protein [Sphingomonas sp. R86520]|uniref:hypothetical protein n=1 Tax=Sphingomonas sp. R86520 TaxID=3093859 RepID=UPI0036D274AA
MSDAAGFVLNLSVGRAEQLQAEADGRGVFPEVVPDFAHSRNVPLTCLISVGGRSITHVAPARRGFRAGVGFRRLNIGPMIELTSPVSKRALTAAVGPRFRRHLVQRLRVGGLMPPATFTAAVEALMDLAADVRPALVRFGSTRRERLARLTPEQRRSLAMQKDTLTTALAIADIDRAPVQEWEPPVDGERATSFLDGLPQMREREDLMVVADLMRVPGFEFVREVAHGAAQFESERTRLTVVMANHLPLEEQLGADLVYFNETYRSFVIVQYKAMEGDDDDGAVFRLPSAQLALELERMERHLELLRGCPQNATRQGYRMLENPFFLKLCPRMQFTPDSQALVKGMYLTLDHWKLIEADETMVGSRGGRIVTYGNVGRHLDNSAFVRLVADAWVGTTVEQSDVLERLIREVLATGRTVTFAVKSDKPPPGDAEQASAIDVIQPHDEQEPPLVVSIG